MNYINGVPPLFVIEAKTAAYRMTYRDLGKIITNRAAAGSVTLTLPPSGTLETGWWVICYGAVLAQNLIVASDTADTITTLNDLTADSVALQTASERAGGGFLMIWDGTSWLCHTMTQETQTVTVVTA